MWGGEHTPVIISHLPHLGPDEHFHLNLPSLYSPRVSTLYLINISQIFGTDCPLEGSVSYDDGWREDIEQWYASEGHGRLVSQVRWSWCNLYI